MAETVKARYEQLASHRREPFLKRAREFAALTIPSLLPPQGFNYSERLPEPYQGLGARGVINLSNRLVMALIPSGQTSFRLGIPPETLMQSGKLELPKEVEQGLALSERLITSEIERSSWRQPTSLTLQLLIVTGNALEQMLPNNHIRVFRLDQYVVCRDASGNLIEVIIQEKISPIALPQEARGLISDKDQQNPDNTVELYTSYKRLQNGSYEAKQELNGKIVPKSRGIYKSALPVFPLRWSIVPGEDYGRGKIEEHIGDLRPLEALSKALLDGAAMAARNVILVKPNAAGGNLRQRIARANNGDVLSGNPEDVHMLQFDNIAGLQIAQAEVQRLTQLLSAAFMLTSELRRDAERVTAYELRLLAEELEGSLGGIYSLLAQDLQYARLQRLIVQMQANRQLPQWDGRMVDTKITTGLEALGREQDVGRVQQAAQIAAGLGQEAFEYIKVPELLSKAYIGLGLPGCVRTDAEVQATREQEAQRQAMAAGMGKAIGAAGANLTQGTNG